MKKKLWKLGKVLIVVTLIAVLGGISFAQAVPSEEAEISPPPLGSGAYKAEIYALAELDPQNPPSPEDADRAAFCAVLWYADRVDRAASGLPWIIPGDQTLQEHIDTLSAQLKNNEFPKEKIDVMQQRVQDYLSEDGKSVVKPPVPEEPEPEPEPEVDPLLQPSIQEGADSAALAEWLAWDAANQEAKKEANGGFMGCDGHP